MSTAEQGSTGEATRYRDVIEHGGHAWVLAHDDVNWFFECLKCGKRQHVVTIPEMNKAIEHSYAYMPVRHRAPWAAENQPYPVCERADDPLPDITGLKRGPLIAVPQDDH